MSRLSVRAGGWMACLVAVTALIGCDSGPKVVRPQVPALEVEASRRTLLVGESAVILAHPYNLPSPDPQIRWETTIGTLTPMNNGRRALFSSDRPGIAIISAESDADGHVVRGYVKMTVREIP